MVPGMGVFQAAARLVDPPPSPHPPPWLAAAGQKWLRGGGGMAKIKENEEKTVVLNKNFSVEKTFCVGHIIIVM